MTSDGAWISTVRSIANADGRSAMATDRITRPATTISAMIFNTSAPSKCLAPAYPGLASGLRRVHQHAQASQRGSASGWIRCYDERRCAAPPGSALRGVFAGLRFLRHGFGGGVGEGLGLGERAQLDLRVLAGVRVRAAPGPLDRVLQR